MLDDEKYQREAFQALLLQQDHKALEIGEQMSRIQNELASLTSVELKKKDLKVFFCGCCLLLLAKCPDNWTISTSDLALALSCCAIRGCICSFRFTFVHNSTSFYIKHWIGEL